MMLLTQLKSTNLVHQISMKKIQQIPKRRKEADKNFPNVINVKKLGMISDLSKFIKLSQENVQGNLGLRFYREKDIFVFIQFVLGQSKNFKISQFIGTMSENFIGLNKIWLWNVLIAIRNFHLLK